MNINEALRTTALYLCAVCWNHLYLPHAQYSDPENFEPVCAVYPDEHDGYVTKAWVESRKQQDALDYLDARKALSDAGVIQSPHKGKDKDTLLKELGF